MSIKYPRTMHLPFSPGSTSDDKFMSEREFGAFIGEYIIITEKLDGSNICMTSDNVYARSHAGPPSHVSFDPLKRFHISVKHDIPKGFSIFGEWCYAVHSIRYTMLQHPLNLFGVRDDETGEWLDWWDVEYFANELMVSTVPVILEGVVNNKGELQNIIENFAQLSSVYGPTREGLVLRRKYGIEEEDGKLIGLGEWARKDHIQTDEHWESKPVEKQKTIIII